jgi:hypothetical protein
MDSYETAADMPDLKYVELPGLEARTGADMMNSPLDNPTPTTNVLLKIHLNAGASLVQIKFDHDLISSIIDGRFKDAQWRMLETGAHYRQCVLLFIGFTSLNKNGKLLINNRRPVDIIGGKAKHFDDMKIIHYHKSLWQKRGGRYEEILPRELPEWLEADLMSTLAEPEKFIYVHRQPMYEEELATEDTPTFIEREWLASQKLTMVKGLRELLRGVDGIGIKRINAIYQYLGNSKHPQNWYGFHEILTNGEILKVEGVGKGTMNKIKEMLNNEG